MPSSSHRGPACEAGTRLLAKQEARNGIESILSVVMFHFLLDDVSLHLISQSRRRKGKRKVNQMRLFTTVAVLTSQPLGGCGCIRAARHSSRNPPRLRGPAIHGWVPESSTQQRNPGDVISFAVERHQLSYVENPGSSPMTEMKSEGTCTKIKVWTS